MSIDALREAGIDSVYLRINTQPGVVVAYATMSYHGLIVEDIKLIINRGRRFVSMPSRRLFDRCRECQSKNNLNFQYCSMCGIALPKDRCRRDEHGRLLLYEDVVYPSSSQLRNRVECALWAEYNRIVSGVIQRSNAPEEE